MYTNNSAKIAGAGFDYYINSLSIVVGKENRYQYELNINLGIQRLLELNFF